MKVTPFAFSLLTFLSYSAAAAAPITGTDPTGIAVAVATPGLLVTKGLAIKSAALVYRVWNFIS